MPLPAIGPLLAGVGKVAAKIAPWALSLFSGHKGRQQQDKNIDAQAAHQMELAEYSHSKDLEMWERANEYNSPAAQMDRLGEAGINPNLAYASGAGNMRAAELPRYQDLKAPDYSNRESMFNMALGAYQSITSHRAQVDNVQSQTKLNEERTAHETLKALLTNAQGLSATARATLDQELANYSKEYVKNQVDQLKLANEKTRADIEAVGTGIQSTEQDVKLKKQVGDMKQYELDWYNQMKGSEFMKNVLPWLNFIKGLSGR